MVVGATVLLIAVRTVAAFVRVVFTVVVWAATFMLRVVCVVVDGVVLVDIAVVVVVVVVCVDVANTVVGIAVCVIN